MPPKKARNSKTATATKSTTTNVKTAAGKLPLSRYAMDAQEPFPRKKPYFAQLAKSGYIAIALESHEAIMHRFLSLLSVSHAL